MNLYLEAERVVYTKSGKESTQTERVDLWQTPTYFTFEVLALPSFKDQLEAYCKWADDKGKSFPDLPEWEELYDYEVKGKETYFNLDNEYWADRSHEQYVKEVVLKGEPKFDEVYSEMERDFLFCHEDKEKGFLGIGFRDVRNLPHSEMIRGKVKRLRDDEYELRFSFI